MAQRKYNVCCERDIFQYCCGVVELGNFEHDDDPGKRKYSTLREAWTDEIAAQRRENPGYPLVFTFVKIKGNRRFDQQTLRGIVKGQKDCVVVHQWTNPNTKNVVEMCVLRNNSKVN